MKNKSQLGAILAVVALVVLVIVIAVISVGGSSPAPEAAKATPKAAAAKTAAATPTPTPTRTPTPTATPTPAGISVAFDGCYIPSQQKSMDFASLQEIWAYPAPVSCSSNIMGAGVSSDLQKKALETAYGADYKIDSLKSLYGVCGRTEGIPIDKIVSGAQAKELAGAYLLCPDHPKAAAIEASIASGQALIAEEEATAAAIAEGRQIDSGKYLVGVDVQPGVWQTVGPKVTECYWEISDAAGNIIENNFINVAPQFSITIPEGAAGFTIQGCTFRKIG